MKKNGRQYDTKENLHLLHLCDVLVWGGIDKKKSKKKP
jgi:hypothetical protein